jgi:hypothetical protein
MMEAVLASETSFNFNVTTRRYIPEDSKLLLLRCCLTIEVRRVKDADDDIKEAGTVLNYATSLLTLLYCLFVYVYPFLLIPAVPRTP